MENPIQHEIAQSAANFASLVKLYDSGNKEALTILTRRKLRTY